jgi:peptidyl-dipeptidase Dcp
MPSQFNEHWAYYPSVLKNYAIHYQTGKPMPNELVEKIKKAETFNQGYSLAEILAASEIDMYWHELDTSKKVNSVDAFEKRALKLSHTDFANIPPRYRSSYFLHIWANGYPAGYYAYLWSEMLDDNIYEWFTQHGGMTRSNGQRFRDMVLSRGHTEDYNVIFKSFNGKEPSIEPLLRHRGI